jgi:hypothetical protein
MRISLIGTYHAERGAVTVSALVGILERLQPEVVFAEIPRTHADAWEEGSHGTVESIAAARYAGTHSIDVVPVDLPKPDESFFRDYQEVSRAIERTSPQFRQLVDINTDRTHREGFAYLNSDDCIAAWKAIHREELETIEYMRRSDFAGIYAHICDLMDQRDLEMIRNIRAYCAATTFTRGVFLVGAAHRESIIEKLRADNEATPRVGVVWDLVCPEARHGW